MFILGDRAMSQRMFMIERVPYANAPNQVDFFKVVCYLTLPFRESLHSHFAPARLHGQRICKSLGALIRVTDISDRP